MDTSPTNSRRSSDDHPPRRSGRPPTAAGPSRATPRTERADRPTVVPGQRPLKPVPAAIDLRTVDLDELDIGSLTVDRSEHLTLDGDHAYSVRDTDPLDLGAEDPERDFDKRPLSEHEYKAWRLADGNRQRSWPSVSSVRRWLGGSWPKVVEHLGQTPSASSLGQRLGAQLGAFSSDELTAQLALCRRELSDDPDKALDYVTQREHRNWARRRLRSADLPLPRLCLQPHTFRDAFGSWGAAVAASGGCQTVQGRRAATLTARPHHFYSRHACVDAVRYVGVLAGGAAMRWPDYEDKAQALKTASAPPEDLPAVLPSGWTIAKKLGSWPEALHVAGFIDAAERDRRLARVTVTLTDKQLLRVMADALRAIGADASKQRYRRYREAMRAEHGPHVGLPSLTTVYQRLGHWPDAKGTVLAEFPDIADCPPTWTEEDE
jgi:hypothetical protein